MTMSREWIAVLLTGIFVLAGCGGESAQPAGGDEEIPTVLGPGEKADNFRSESAQEYYVTGTTTITLGSD